MWISLPQSTTCSITTQSQSKKEKKKKIYCSDCVRKYINAWMNALKYGPFEDRDLIAQLGPD